MNKTIILDEKKIQTKMFVTRQSAQKFINKTGGELVFIRAHEYYVEVK